MATVASDIILDALQVLGVYAASETMNDTDSAKGLSVLNDMMDEWSNLNLNCYQITEQSGVLVVGQQTYTVGSGGNFNVTRPLNILMGDNRAYVTDTNGNIYTLTVVDRVGWNMIGNRSTTITSNFPDTLFYDPQWPLGVINVYPTPSVSYTLYWDSLLPLTTFAALTTTFTLPPGYKRAITLNLAIELHPYFGGQLMPEVATRASISLAAIKRKNLESRPMNSTFDSEIVTKAKGVYNPYSDGFGSGSSTR